MIILTHIDEFLNTDINKFYKPRKDDVRKHYNIPSDDKLNFNGFNTKPVIFINESHDLNRAEIKIQRMIWYEKSGSKTHIYLRPSFTIAHCPYSTCTMEYIWKECLRISKDPFLSKLNDPDFLLVSSLSLEHHIEKLFAGLEKPEYVIKWNHLFHTVQYSMPSYVTDALTKSEEKFANRFLFMVESFAYNIRHRLPRYGHLSFANFLVSFK